MRLARFPSPLISVLCLWLGLCLASVSGPSATALAQTPPPATTDTPSLAQRLAVIEGHLAADRPAEALRAARDFYLATGRITGLQLSPPILVTGPAPSLGVYQPRAGNVFATDETVQAYAEATGFGFETDAAGQTRIHLRMAFRLVDAAGRDQSGLVEMGEVELASRAQPMDVFLNLTYRITGAKGPYVLRTDVTDLIGGHTHSFDLPIRFQ